MGNNLVNESETNSSKPYVNDSGKKVYFVGITNVNRVKLTIG